MSDKKELVCFIGMKNCGKDYSAQPYIEKGFVKIAFADTLRDMCYDILGYYPYFSKEYDEFKKSDICLSKYWFMNKFITTGRKILQNLGSTIKKYFGEDIWAKLWYEQVLRYNTNTVVTDCRFPVEINKILSLTKKGYKVTFVWVCYEGANFKEILKDTHESEALAQFIYHNQIKYNLQDLTPISNTLIKQILKDFAEYQKTSKIVLDN